METQDGIPSSFDAAQFEANRALMFAIAYRMLGSASEAEDIVQEAWLRCQALPAGEVRSARALLSTIVTRLCLNQLQSARSRRETYIGPWLPEPVRTGAGDAAASPARQAELHDSISIAFLVLLEQLTPSERAVFLLREVFAYDYAEIAEMVGRDEAACRQMLSRARKHLLKGRPRFRPDRQTHQRLLDQFVQAAGGGDVDRLAALLAEDAVLWADGGGKARGAALHPLCGREAVAGFVLAITRLLADGAWAEISEINGDPAVVVHKDGGVLVVLSITVDSGSIREIRAMGNPDKLKWIGGSGGRMVL